MPDGVTIEIKGLAELQQKLTELSTTAADRCIRTALRAGAVIEQSAIAESAPVRPDLPSGTALPVGALSHDIVVKMKRSDQGNIAAIIGPDKYTAHVARFLEDGHRLVRGGKSRKSRRTGLYSGPGQHVSDVEAHPFIGPAFDATREAATTAIIKTLGSEIEKASKAK